MIRREARPDAQARAPVREEREETSAPPRSIDRHSRLHPVLARSLNLEAVCFLLGASSLFATHRSKASCPTSTPFLH